MIDILISGGPVMIPLGMLSLVAFAIILDRLWVLRRSNFMQNSTVETLSGLLAGNKYRGAVDYCRRYPGPFTDLVTALVENRQAPYDELKEILEDSLVRFERHVAESNATLFSEWNDRGDLFLLAMDVTKFMMEGMAAGQLMTNRDERIRRLLNYLADRLEEIFEEGEGSAIGRHSTG